MAHRNKYETMLTDESKHDDMRTDRECGGSGGNEGVQSINEIVH